MAGSVAARRQRGLAVAAGVAIAVIVLVALWPSDRPNPPDGFEWFFDRPNSRREMAGNVLLFIPAGALVWLAWARRWAALALLTVLSPVLEAVQGLVGSLRRQASAADIALNWSGIALGVAIALAFARLTRRRDAGGAISG